MHHFTTEQMQRARKTDLHEYLLRYHADSFKIDGVSIHPRDNGSLSIKRGYSGYMDFATGDKGNSVDFLVKYMNYELDQAVFSLCGESATVPTVQKTEAPKIENLPPVFPDPVQGRYKNLYAYLLKRGISQETIQMLIDQKILYQEADYNNMVFANKERDWGELRGTYDQGEKSFHGVVANCRHDGFWWFQIGEGKAEKVFICEAAIDAISLYEIHRKDNLTGNHVYVSIGGVMKQPAIDRLKRHTRVILAVDNDEAGSECRKRNAELESIIPNHKDWNEDLLQGR